MADEQQDAGEVLEERWLTILMATVTASALWWWRRVRRTRRQRR